MSLVFLETVEQIVHAETLLILEIEQNNKHKAAYESFKKMF